MSMSKVDRSRLYGFKEMLVLDEEGDACELATLGDDGRKVVGRGGTGVGYLTADGNWCDRDSLRPVNLEGETITPVKSSFGAPIDLSERVTMDQFLDHSIRLIYRLEPRDAGLPDSLLGELQSGVIFRFDYSYRGGLEADAGFLISNEAGETFLLVGTGTEVHFVGLQQPASVRVSEDDPTADPDPMDFGMM